MGAGSLRPMILNAEGFDIVTSPIFYHIMGGTVADESRSRSEGPCNDVDDSVL